MKLALVNLITRTSLCRNVIPVIDSNRDAMIVKFAQELKRRGADCELFVSDVYQPKKEEDLPVTVHYLPTVLKRLFWPSRLPLTPSLIKELKNNFDIVVCSETFQWSTVLAVLAKIFSSKRKMRIVVWQEIARHQKFLRRIPSIIFHKVFLRFLLDPFIACYVPRSVQAAKFLKNQGISTRKITNVIPHGYDQSIFFCDSVVRKEHYLFSPSRLVFSKGVDVLLKAFALVSHSDFTVNLIIQGDGPLGEEYRRLAKDLKIEDRVTFDNTRQNHQDMRLRYQKALATVICSREDSVIFSNMESIACGTPVVLSTGVDSHLDYYDQKGGMSFRSEDHEQLAKILNRLINDYPYRKKMEEGALKKSRRYQNTYVSKKFLEVLRAQLRK